eukprot:5589552-Ditylum_brightwellii.AAC.1
MFAENLKPGTSRTCESNKLQKIGGWGGKGDGDAGNGKDKPWKNDYSAWVPTKELYRLPREGREKQTKGRAEARNARETQTLQMNFLQKTQPRVPTSPSTTMVIYVPGTQVMTPVLAGISDGGNN